MTLPFRKIKDDVLGFERDRKCNIACAYVRLVYADAFTKCKHTRWAEITLNCPSNMPRWQVKRAIRHTAWQALHDFYNGHDMLGENLFLDDGISDVDDRALYRDLKQIELRGTPVALQGHLMRWLMADEVPQEFTQIRQQEAA